MTLDTAAFTGPQAEFVSMQRAGYLATAYPDGRPHVVPISAVLDMNRLVFATERDTQKIRNLRGDPNVAICFDDYHEDWSKIRQLIAHGEAYFIDGGPEFERDRSLLYEKFPQYPATSPIEQETSLIVEIRVDRVVSWGL
jgi:nitroimidazol reductase NimA-like FMN-containing flavoprotein (pyridoxamine 5'-phosphate oxidase superfamily)